MPQAYGVNIFLVHQIRISTINVSSVMLGIKTVFGRPYKEYPHYIYIHLEKGIFWANKAIV